MSIHGGVAGSIKKQRPWLHNCVDCDAKCGMLSIHLSGTTVFPNGLFKYGTSTNHIKLRISDIYLFHERRGEGIYLFTGRVGESLVGFNCASIIFDINR